MSPGRVCIHYFHPVLLQELSHIKHQWDTLDREIRERNHFRTSNTSGTQRGVGHPTSSHCRFAVLYDKQM